MYRLPDDGRAASVAPAGRRLRRRPLSSQLRTASDREDSVCPAPPTAMSLLFLLLLLTGGGWCRLLINGPPQYTALATLSARSLIQCGMLCDPVPACGGVVYGQTGPTSCVLASLPTATTEPTAEITTPAEPNTTPAQTTTTPATTTTTPSTTTTTPAQTTTTPATTTTTQATTTTTAATTTTTPAQTTTTPAQTTTTQSTTTTTLAVTTTTTATTTTTPTPACQTGWTQGFNSCYRLFNIPKYWPDAEASCETEASGAHLISISSEEENLFVKELAPVIVTVQIGLRHLPEDGVDAQGKPIFRWTDGTPLMPSEFQPWDGEQPNEDSSKELGTNLYPILQKWNDFPVHKYPNPYVCEYKLQ